MRKQICIIYENNITCCIISIGCYWIGIKEKHTDIVICCIYTKFIIIFNVYIFIIIT